MISDFKDIHKNETCLVIGNGPSLRDVSNSFLDTYPSFGSNRIFLKYIPTYYVCVNPLVIAQNKSTIEMLDCEKFIRAGMTISGNQLQNTQKRIFSFEPDKYIYEGYTVTFVSLQLAYYMGFTTVLLVGVDHRYQYDGKPNEENILNKDDPNHFDPDYFKGQKWNNPDLFQSEISYNMALIAFTQDNRRIINLTKGTDLNVFEKDDISKW